MSPVKDQLYCGSWPFAAVACLESANLIQHQVLMKYSEQQLLDCSSDFNNNGCDSGLPSQAFEYLFDAGGAITEPDDEF